MTKNDFSTHYEQELHEVDFLASEIRHAQYTQREHESQRNAAEDEEQLQLALALSLSHETTTRNNDINAKQTLLQEWKSEVQDARDILGEDGSAQPLIGSSTTIEYCKEVLKLNSMFDGNAIPVDVQKQQRVVEKLRDNLETELGYNIFSKSLRSGYERISIIHKLTQDSLDNIDNVDYDQLCMDRTDCDVLLTLQTQASHALCTNDLQVRAYQEAYIYLSRLLNKDVNREFWLDEANVKNEFEKFSIEISSVDP